MRRHCEAPWRRIQPFRGGSVDHKSNRAPSSCLSSVPGRFSLTSRTTREMEREGNALRARASSALQPPNAKRPRGVRRRGRKASGPVSRVLSRTIIYLGRASPRASSTQPECTEGRPYRTPICACSRWGFPSRAVAGALVRSYRTVSAFLLAVQRQGSLLFCGTFRRVAPPSR